jgi:hypothetical protein
MPYDDEPHSGRKLPFELRSEEGRAEKRASERQVTCKGLVYVHQTEKAILVQEGEDLAGPRWRIDGKKTWFPKSAVGCVPGMRSLDVGDMVELTMTKRLADEKEMMYDV